MFEGRGEGRRGCWAGPRVDTPYPRCVCVVEGRGEGRRRGLEGGYRAPQVRVVQLFSQLV